MQRPQKHRRFVEHAWTIEEAFWQPKRQSDEAGQFEA
jgi:hypothetical protein